MVQLNKPGGHSSHCKRSQCFCISLRPWRRPLRPLRLKIFVAICSKVKRFTAKVAKDSAKVAKEIPDYAAVTLVTFISGSSV